MQCLIFIGGADYSKGIGMLLNATLAILTIGLKQITKLSQRTGTRQTTYSVRMLRYISLIST